MEVRQHVKSRGIKGKCVAKKFFTCFFNNHIFGDSISIVILKLSTMLSVLFGIKQKLNYVEVVENQALWFEREEIYM